MKKWLKDLEIIVDKIIPYLILVLLAVIIIDLFFHNLAEQYKIQISLIDGFIILTFVIDLIYKYNRVRNFPKFVKEYWLEILAVLPFYLIFRVIETTIGFLEISGVIKQGQNLFHSGVEVEREISLITKEAEEIEKIGARTNKFARIFRTVERTPRLMTASKFYENPKVIQEELKIAKYIKKKLNRPQNNKRKKNKK